MKKSQVHFNFKKYDELVSSIRIKGIDKKFDKNENAYIMNIPYSKEIVHKLRNNVILNYTTQTEVKVYHKSNIVISGFSKIYFSEKEGSQEFYLNLKVSTTSLSSKEYKLLVFVEKKEEIEFENFGFKDVVEKMNLNHKEKKISSSLKYDKKVLENLMKKHSCSYF